MSQTILTDRTDGFIMKTKLSLQEKLRDLRYEQGNQKLEQVSAATGISTSALSSYEKDELIDIPHSSIVALAKHYHVSADYLLGLTEIRDEGNADIEDLSINDDMVRLLKSGAINNRLLCELVAHPGFIKFLTDLEIYVDGKAGIQIQSLNAIVDAIRDMILTETEGDSSSASDGRTIEMLKAAHIEDDAYFFNLLHHDLDAIAKDLREDHKHDSDAVPDDMISSQINTAIEDVRSITEEAGGTKKNLIDLLMYYFSKEIRMPLDKLTAEEKEELMSIFERSGRNKAELRNMTKGRRKKR